MLCPFPLHVAHELRFAKMERTRERKLGWLAHGLQRQELYDCGRAICGNTLSPRRWRMFVAWCVINAQSCPATCKADHLSAAGVGESIVEQAADGHAALIVLGSRGMGAIKRCPPSLPPPHPASLFMRLRLRIRL